MRQVYSVGRAGAGQRPLAEVEEGLVAHVGGQALEQLRVFCLDLRGVLLQADHVVAEDAEHRRLDAGGGVALQRIDEVLGHQLARALLLEVPGRALVAQLRAREVVVPVLAALLVLRERGVRLEQDAALDGHVVDALGHLVGRRIGQAARGRPCPGSAAWPPPLRSWAAARRAASGSGSRTAARRSGRCRPIPDWRTTRSGPGGAGERSSNE